MFYNVYINVYISAIYIIISAIIYYNVYINVYISAMGNV